jgi:DNA-binding NarL/FixJ family response regulator
MINVALADDHVLLRNGLASLVESFGYTIVFQADNGKQFIQNLKTHPLPNIVLMDINMPVMDGYETAVWLKENHPGIKILALYMYDDENSIIKMFKAGAKGYILKDCDPEELKVALNAIDSKGFYYNEVITGTLIHSIISDDNNDSFKSRHELNSKEREFIKLACTELTYKEISEKMFTSPRTVDTYRDNLFAKLHIKTRVGLVMYAIKNGIIHI